MKEDIINESFKQNCGDTLIVLEKTNKKKNNLHLYKCKFLKYPYIDFYLKDSIKKGKCLNPQIEKFEFLDRIWLQNCGDSLKILNIYDNKGPNNQRRFLCEFQKYPYKIIKLKKDIISKTVLNPQIEKIEFLDKIWIQNCGDSLKVLEKTNIKAKNTNKFLFKVEFINYPYITLARKDAIINGNIINENLPWKDKESLKNYILDNFKNKPSLSELSNKLNISLSQISKQINIFNLQDFINYLYKEEENKLKNLIEIFNRDKISTYEDNKYEIDCYIKNLNLGFEYNGNYWHSNLFKESNYHQEKSLYFKNKGIRLIHIWEWEIKNKKDIIESLINNLINNSKFKRIGARKCIVKEINYKEYADFCEVNHLQGPCGAKVKLGLFNKEELVQVMSFGVPRFSNKHKWEIIRECSKLNYIIIGGKEKLWKYFLDNYKPDNCISYCDFSKFNGNSYIKLGFKLERLNKAGFWWLDKKSRQVYLRTPWKNDYFKNEGYYKLYDCGQLVFTWENNEV